MQIGSRVYDAQELQKLVPQLEDQLEKKDRQLRQNQMEMEAQQKRIGKLEAEVKGLQSECDKLRSVLNQKVEEGRRSGSSDRREGDDREIWHPNWSDQNGHSPDRQRMRIIKMAGSGRTFHLFCPINWPFFEF